MCGSVHRVEIVFLFSSSPFCLKWATLTDKHWHDFQVIESIPTLSGRGNHKNRFNLSSNWSSDGLETVCGFAFEKKSATWNPESPRKIPQNGNWWNTFIATFGRNKREITKSYEQAQLKKCCFSLSKFNFQIQAEKYKHNVSDLQKLKQIFKIFTIWRNPQFRSSKRSHQRRYTAH